MKNKLSVILVFVLVLSVFFVGCSSAAEKDDLANEDSQVVTTDEIDKKEPSVEIEKNQTEKVEKNDSEKNVETKQENPEKEDTPNKISDNGNKTEKNVQKNESTKPIGNNNNPANKDNVDVTPDDGTNVDVPPVENENKTPEETPPVTDKMNWPDNEYTKLVPKPSRGVVRKADKQDGIYCILMTGADMVDAKTYAANLINCGFTSEVTETIETDTYLFGGGNSSGTFVVVSYQNGQFIVGIER